MCKCNNKKRKALCCNCYPKRFTDYFDMFAEPVYHFTFRDSYVVSTCMGALCTCGYIAGLAFVIFFKTILYLDNDPNTFTVTEGVEYGWYQIDTEFNQHQMAIGLIYKPEFQS